MDIKQFMMKETLGNYAQKFREMVRGASWIFGGGGGRWITIRGGGGKAGG